MKATAARRAPPLLALLLAAATWDARAAIEFRVTQSPWPVPQYRLTATGERPGTPAVTLTYEATPLQSEIRTPDPAAADTRFIFDYSWITGAPETNSLAVNQFGATFLGKGGGMARYVFSQPLIGDVATGVTTMRTYNEMQHASFRFTLKGGARWTKASVLPRSVSCGPQPAVPLTITGLGTSVLEVKRPAGDPNEGCDNLAMEASGAFVEFATEAIDPIRSAIDFIPAETLRTEFVPIVQALSPGVTVTPTASGSLPPNAAGFGYPVTLTCTGADGSVRTLTQSGANPAAAGGAVTFTGMYVGDHCVAGDDVAGIAPQLPAGYAVAPPQPVAIDVPFGTATAQLTVDNPFTYTAPPTNPPTTPPTTPPTNPPTPPAQPTPVPALGPFALALLSALVGGAGLCLGRRRRENP